jgi:alpha-beta hydrolase superfamily lysophospholipase
MAAAVEGVRHRTLEANGVRLHVAEAGPEEGSAPVVLLLHGFPDLWYGWRHQMSALAARGYRAVAPDLRGYGDSDSPPDASSYTTFHVVGDLVALISDLGQRQVLLQQSVRFVAQNCEADTVRWLIRPLFFLIGFSVRCRCSWWGTTGEPPWRGSFVCFGRTWCGRSWT